MDSIVSVNSCNNYQVPCTVKDFLYELMNSNFYKTCVPVMLSIYNRLFLERNKKTHFSILWINFSE